MTTTHENKGQSTSDIVLVILKNYNDARNSECKMYQIHSYCTCVESNNTKNSKVQMYVRYMCNADLYLNYTKIKGFFF